VRSYDNLEGDLILIGHLSRKIMYCHTRICDHIGHSNGPHDMLYCTNNLYVQFECQGLEHSKNINAEASGLSVKNRFVDFTL